MIKESIRQDVTILNAPNNKAARYMKLKLLKLKRERQSYNYSWSLQQPLFSIVNRTTRQKISKDKELNNAIKILNKFKRTEIMQSMFSNHNGIKLRSITDSNRKIYQHLETKQHLQITHGSKRKSQRTKNTLS